MFDFVASLFDHGFMNDNYWGDIHDSEKTSHRQGKFWNSSKDNPNRCHCVPLHPFQTFSRYCARIERNDPSLTIVEFRDEFLNVRRLAHAIAKNEHIVELNLIQSIRDRETGDSRPRSAPAHDVLHLCMEGLRHNTSIQRLDLTETTVRASGAAFVSRGLQHHPQVRKLRLARCLLQDEGLRRMAGAPLGMQLEELDLSGNALSDGSAVLQVVVNNPHLKKLDMSNNALSAKGIEHFFLGHDGFHALEHLDLSRNHIRRDAAHALGMALADEKCRLKELYLDANDMMESAIDSIVLGLKHNTSLEKLSMNNNFLGDVGAIKIAVSLGVNSESRLRELRLSGVKLHNSGALALIKQAGDQIVKMDLSGNRISDGRSICQVLRLGNTLMRRLNLSRNPIPLQHSHEIEFWSRLNASGGRQLLTDVGDNKQGGGFMAVWANVLGRVSDHPNGLYYFLIRKPEICQLASSMKPNQKKKLKGER
jgi:Ran GTPase-activating protein (RanGAP) involved in mRNA processing and transport